MSRKTHPWFRFYVEAVSDRKLRRRTPAQRWLWVALLAAARQSPVPGWLMVSTREPMDQRDIADFAGMTIKEVRNALPLFEQSEMIEWDGDLDCWHVTNFASRQFESDDVTARTRKHRAKERDGNVPNDVEGTTWERSGNDANWTLGTHQSRDRAETEDTSRTLSTSTVVGGLAGIPEINEWAERRRLS